MRPFIFKVQVSGESLWPELVPGRIYWATGLLAPKAGDYAVFRSPDEPGKFVVKKVKSVQDGLYELVGTVPWSSSYKVPKSQILGRLLGV